MHEVPMLFKAHKEDTILHLERAALLSAQGSD